MQRVHHRRHHHHRSTALYKIFIRFNGRPSNHSLIYVSVCVSVSVYVWAMCVRTFSVHAWCEMPLCTFRFALDFNPIKIVCAPFYCCCCCCCFYCRWWCSEIVVVVVVHLHRCVYSRNAFYSLSYGTLHILVFHKLVTLALCHTLLSSSVIAIMLTMLVSSFSFTRRIGGSKFWIGHGIEKCLNRIFENGRTQCWNSERE